VTGSANQYGDVQAIGGVNEKIEGFFDTCRQRGLSGEQRVLIPDSNVKHLMLREDVVAAVREGSFHVYPFANIDEGLAIVTGRDAGASAGHELLALGMAGGVPGRLRLGSTAQRALEHADHLLHDATPLQVLMWCNSRDKLADLEQQARQQLGGQAAEFHALVGGGGAALGDAVLRLAPSTLIIGEPAPNPSPPAPRAGRTCRSGTAPGGRHPPAPAPACPRAVSSTPAAALR